MMPMIMKGAISKPVASSPSATTTAAPGASVRTFLKSLSSLHPERQHAELFVDRDFLAHDGGSEHLPDGIVGIDLRRVFRHLNRDIAGEGDAGHDHRIAPHIAALGVPGVFDGIIAEAR